MAAAGLAMGAHAQASANFHAHVELATPALAEGVLTSAVESKTSFTFAQPSNPEVVLVRAGRADVAIVDWSLEDGPSPPGAGESFSVSNVRDVEVRLPGTGQSPWVTLLTSTGIQTPSTTCSFLPKSASVSAAAISTGVRPSPVVSIECLLAGMPLGNASRAFFSGGLVQVGWSTGGAQEVRMFDTGILTVPDGAGGTARVQRSVRVTLGAATAYESSIGVPMRFEAPHLVVAGALRVPPASGSLRWDDLQREGRTPLVETRGTFDVGAEERIERSAVTRFLNVQGAAEPRPVAAPVASQPVPNPDPILLGGGAVVVAAGLGFALWKAWPTASALFTRVKRSAILENGRRRLIHDVIFENPGASLKQVTATTGLAKTVVKHHVGVLLRGRLVENLGMGRATSFFARGRLPSAAELHLRNLVPNTVARRLVACLRANPRQTERELATCVSVSQQHVSRLLQWLEARHHVRVTDDPLGRHYALSPALDASLRRAVENPPAALPLPITIGPSGVLPSAPPPANF